MSWVTKKYEKWTPKFTIDPYKMNAKQNSIIREIITIKQGDVYEEEFSVSAEQFLEFSKLTGDTNPIHLDPQYCDSTRFRTPIAPGMLIACVFSKIISTKFPGPGTIYREQNLKFTGAIYPGDELVARLEVLEIDVDEGKATLKTIVKNGTMVSIDGTAKVFLSKVFVRPSHARTEQPKLKQGA